MKKNKKLYINIPTTRLRISPSMLPIYKASKLRKTKINEKIGPPRAVIILSEVVNLIFSPSKRHSPK